MPDDTSRFVGDIPHNYDKYLGPVIFSDFAGDMSRAAGKVHARDVLELAAGTGIVSRQLLNALHKDARLSVTDLNAPMLEVARAKFDAKENVNFSAEDAQQLAMEDDSFDLVVCQFGVMFFPLKIRSYKEVLRVLRPRGSYLLTTWGTLEHNPFAKICNDVIQELFPQNPPPFYQIPFSCADPKIIKEELLGAGFPQVSHREIHFRKPVSDWQAFSRGLIYGNPLIDEINARAGASAPDVAREIQTRLRAFFGDEPTSMPLGIHLFHAHTD